MTAHNEEICTSKIVIRKYKTVVIRNTCFKYTLRRLHFSNFEDNFWDRILRWVLKEWPCKCSQTISRFDNKKPCSQNAQKSILKITFLVFRKPTKKVLFLGSFSNSKAVTKTVLLLLIWGIREIRLFRWEHSPEYVP